MSCRTLIWILALASPAVATPALLTQNRSIPIQVSCGFDVTGLALVAGKLGTSFYKVQENCRNPQTDRERRNCASQITVMLAFAGIAASFTSAAASDCAASLSEPAECAISTTGFVGILNFVASAAIALKGACIEDLKPLWKEFLEPSPRRLRGNTSDHDLDDFPDLRSLEMRAAKASNTKGVVALQKLPANAPQVLDHELYHKIRDLVAAREKRQVKVADCVFDSGLSAMFLGRGIMNVILAAERSPCDEFDDYGDHLEERTTACLIQASGIPSIFTLVATLIAASVSVCPVKSNAAATCAKDILALISGVTALIQEGAAISLECGPEDENKEQLDEDLADSIVA